MDYDLVPCTNCIEDSLRLERWRKDVHTAHVIRNADTPERWRKKYDRFYTEGSA